MTYAAVAERLWATCAHCGDHRHLRRDGLIAVHGPHPYAPGQWNCPGSKRPPLEGLVMPCIWCSRRFISEDKDHRFCSEFCVEEWEQKDGSWDDWDALGNWPVERAWPR